MPVPKFTRADLDNWTDGLPHEPPPEGGFWIEHGRHIRQAPAPQDIKMDPLELVAPPPPIYSPREGNLVPHQDIQARPWMMVGNILTLDDFGEPPKAEGRALRVHMTGGYRTNLECPVVAAEGWQSGWFRAAGSEAVGLGWWTGQGDEEFELPPGGPWQWFAAPARFAWHIYCVGNPADFMLWGMRFNKGPAPDDY